jgi:hypothetical protein
MKDSQRDEKQTNQPIFALYRNINHIKTEILNVLHHNIIKRNIALIKYEI